MEIIEHTSPFTLTSAERIFAFKNAIEYVIKNDIAGDIVECAVWNGGSMMAAALTLLCNRAGDRTRAPGANAASRAP
jgi:O-methyltransferase